MTRREEIISASIAGLQAIRESGLDDAGITIAACYLVSSLIVGGRELGIDPTLMMASINKTIRDIVGIESDA